VSDRRRFIRSRMLALAGVLAWGSAPVSLAVNPEAADTAAQQPLLYHTVEPGESLWEIAKRYGISRARLIRENGIENPDRLWAGARLRIPVSSAARPPAPDAHATQGASQPAVRATQGGGRPTAPAQSAAGADSPRAGGARAIGTRDAAALVDRCEAEVRAARFEQALESASQARKRIDARNDAADNPDRVRLEIASATAYVALGQNDAALASLERALVADPGLELDPARTSPKVLAVFHAARALANRGP